VLGDLAARIRRYHEATTDSLRCSVDSMHEGELLLAAEERCAGSIAKILGINIFVIRLGYEMLHEL
jgi:hypothetical protein